MRYKNSETGISIETLIEGDRRTISKAITVIENDPVQSADLLDKIYSHTGNAWRIGITGPPGAGKSTFANQLIKRFREQNKSVGVIAVDPSSPFSGGAILGDRVRMQAFFGDNDVFIRSMATRGSLGGLAAKTAEAADVLDASGKDIILLETVGVGQIELDIIGAADSIIVMTVPDAGDVIQGLKAGLMEIADLFVINKKDLQGAGRMKADLEFALHLRPEGVEWQPPILQTESRNGEGVTEVMSALLDHWNYLKKNRLIGRKRRQRLEDRVRRIVNEGLVSGFWTEEQETILYDYLKNGDNQSPYKIANFIVKMNEI